MDKKIKNVSNKNCPKEFIEIPEKLYKPYEIKRDSFIRRIKNLKYKINVINIDLIDTYKHETNIYDDKKIINMILNDIKNSKYEMLTLNSQNEIVLNPATCLIRVGKRHRIKIHKKAVQYIDNIQLETFEQQSDDPTGTVKIISKKINKIKFHDEDHSIGIQWDLMNETPIPLEKKEYIKIKKEIKDIKELIAITTKTIKKLYGDNMDLENALFAYNSKNQFENLKKLIKK